MDITHWFTFGGVNSSDYSILLLDSTNRGWEIKRDYESVSIPGRNGDLHIDHGRFENLEIVYQCAVMHNPDEMLSSLNMELMSLTGYHRLEDTFDPEVYRMARFVNGLDVTPAKMRNAARVDLTFDCKPQKFLKSGEMPVAFVQNGAIYNAERFASKPLIRIYGNGDITVGDTVITWSGSSAYVDVDCEVQDCFYMGSNMNQYVELNRNEFPEFQPGSTNITLGQGVSKVVITPRWWRI